MSLIASPCPAKLPSTRPLSTSHRVASVSNPVDELTSPIPSGVISPFHALVFGEYMVLGGTAVLMWQVNLLTAFLALLTAFLYALVYTPMKRVSWLNTPI